MPEGPEVRHYAESIDRALRSRPLRSVTARTRAAKAWLLEHPGVLPGRRVLSVRAHGKNLYGLIEGGYYFYSHLMMWGRWQILPSSDAGAPDRRERARLANDECTAILLSAPVFEIGEGHPYDSIEYLRALGPDTLPYDDAGPFDTAEFLRRLLSDENRERAIGVALLDQRIAAGLGNYLRAEILFHCRLNPFVRVADLSQDALDCLCETIPAIAKLAYDCGGVTIDEEQQARVHEDAELSYPGKRGRPNAARHAVFRRTNLPCLVCGDTVRQLRQITQIAGDDEDGSLDAAPERSRIIYFCPTCQGIEVAPRKAARRKTQTP
jgi:formamidopyrimidine-DNA glycosylase